MGGTIGFGGSWGRKTKMEKCHVMNLLPPKTSPRKSPSPKRQTQKPNTKPTQTNSKNPTVVGGEGW